MPSQTTASAFSSATRRITPIYRSILSQPLPQADNVSPDYKTQASALLVGDPVGIDTIGDYTVAPYYLAYY